MTPGLVTKGSYYIRNKSDVHIEKAGTKKFEYLLCLNGSKTTNFDRRTTSGQFAKHCNSKYYLFLVFFLSIYIYIYIYILLSFF